MPLLGSHEVAQTLLLPNEDSPGPAAEQLRQVRRGTENPDLLNYSFGNNIHNNNLKRGGLFAPHLHRHLHVHDFQSNFWVAEGVFRQ